MNGSAQRPAEPASAPFFRRFLTKCRKSAPGILALALVVGLTISGRWLMASAVATRGVKVAEAPPTAVRLVPVADEVVSAGIRYSGVVKELQKAEVSFRVSGTVEFLHRFQGPGGKMRNIHEGDRLRAGEVVARLDPRDYRRDRAVAAARMATAQAKMAQLQSDTELADVEYRRTENLVRKAASSTSDLDAARAKIRNATAAELAARREVETAQIEVEKADANLEYCTLAMPFPEGTVSARYVEKDERIAANQRAFLLTDLSAVVIAFNVPDTLVGRLAIGQRVAVGTDALPEERFEGLIHKIAATADPLTRTYPIEVRVDSPRGLRPGMVANVAFRREQRAYLLPLTAFAPGASGRGYSAFRLGDDRGEPVIRRVPVEFDAVLDNRVAVRVGGPGGLAPGDRVVSTGIHRLHDGERVLVIE